MKSFLNLIIITLICSYANAATTTKTIPVTGSKTVPPVTNKILSTKTLPIKTIPSSSVLTSTISVPLKVQYYTTVVSASANGIYQTTVLPNTEIAYDIVGCIPTKGYVERVEEICTASSSLTYCKPYTTSIFKGSTFCHVSAKTISYTIPVSSRTCYTTYENCEVKTRKFSKTVLPADDYYNEVKYRNSKASKTSGKTVPNSTTAKSVETLSDDLLTYEYQECRPVTETMECYYPETDLNFLTITAPPTTEPDILIPATLPPKSTTTTTTASVSIISNTVTYPPKKTSKLNMNLYTTVLKYNDFSVTSIVPVNRKVSISECRSTIRNADRIIDDCITIDRVSTSCRNEMAGTRVTHRSCTFSTEVLDSPLTVTPTKCPEKSCTKEIQYTTFYSSSHEIIRPRTTNVICSTIDVDCVIPVTDVITPSPESTTPPITVPPEATITITTTTTPAITNCPTVTITHKEKETVTETEKETVTVTVKGSSADNSSACAEKYEQCGGEGYTGPTCCEEGLTCRRLTRYFSHCE